MKRFIVKNILGGGDNRLNKENDYPKKYKQIHILLFSIICILFIVGIFFIQDRETNNLLTKNSNDTYFAFYIDGVSSSTFPSQNTEYTLDTSASNCTNGVIPSWDYSTWSFVGDYSNYQSSNNTATRCNLYFVKNQTVSTALGELSVYPYTPDFTKSACDNEVCESHEKGIYAMTLDDGSTSYYYRGSVENNYLQFAGYWWRVIRINENGSIRIIYDGKEAHHNGENNGGVDRQIGSSMFNVSGASNEYVGYMYTLGEARGFTNSSLIKEVNDNFYADYLALYSQYIDTESGFCGDRSTLNLQSGVGTGTVTTYYKGYLRTVTSSPDLNCENANDLYTVSSSSQGNKALTYPIGLITVDEVMIAGAAGCVFDGYINDQAYCPTCYLQTGNYYWTMTPTGGYVPYGFNYWTAVLLGVDAYGNIADGLSNAPLDVRPVINIKQDAQIVGEGTIENPYKLSVE